MFNRRNLFIFVLFLLAIFVFTGCSENGNKIEEVFDELFENVDLTAVDGDLNFPESMEDVQIIYESNRPEILSNEGKVVRGIRDEVVTLNITLKSKEYEVIKKVAIVILKDHNLLIEDVYKNLFNGKNFLEVTDDLTFLTEKDGVKIKYESENEDVITNSGVITRDKEDKEVIVNITLESSGIIVHKVLKVKVLKDDNLLVSKVFNDLFKNIDLNQVTSDLDFVSEVDGVSISYESNHPSIISNNGKVTRSYEDKEVNIIVTLKYADVEVNKTLKITVLKDDNLFLNYIFNGLFKNVNLFKVTNNLDFKTSISGVNISYESSNLTAIDNSGKVIRKSFDDTANVKIVLTYNNAVLEKTISVTILRDPNLYVDQVFSSLYKNIDLDNLTADLNFITSKDGVTFTYTSSDPSIISNSGVINRGIEDKQVKIDVTIKYEDFTITKVMFVTVSKEENSSYPIINAINASLNQTVTVQGIVIGIVGQNYYIHDGSNGVYLYLLGNGYEIGDEIRVTGVRTVYSGLIELKDNKDIKILRSNVSLPTAIEIQSLSQINKQSTLYSISNLVIVEYDSFRSGRDVFIKVKDSTNNTMEIIISKHVETYYLNQIKDKLFGMTVGDKLHLINVISSYYNGYQIAVSSPDQLTLEYDDGSVVTSPIDSYYPRPEDMRFLVDELDEFLTSGINPIGQANVLIIPINFTDYVFSNQDLENLEKAFFGSSEDTGWESVKTYYDKSSYGKFSFTGQILSPFQTNNPSTYYAQKFNKGIDADYEIIKAALEYYDKDIDYSLYDNNDDGYIDGLYFIYAAPTWYGEETGAINDSDLWWAYVYQYYTEDYELYDGVEANYYLWAGVDFMYEAFTYDEYRDYYIDINAATYIHETGHMLGLYDYYDYEEDQGPNGGLGGADMMDYTVGDHNSFSKLMFNWVTPLVVSGKNTTVTIDSFSSSGDVILVSTNWNNSYFDEYFLIEFYTPTGLNEAHAGFNGLFSISGVRIFHVNAQINEDQSDGNLFLYDNSYTEPKILKPIEADGNNSVELYSMAEDTDLFQAGDVFGRTSSYRLANGGLVNFNIKIVETTNNSATIEIEWFN